MKGVIVIPNMATPSAVIERSDGLFMIVEPMHGSRLALMDVVEMADIPSEPRMRLKNLTTEVILEVLVQKVDLDLSWEEKMSLLGKVSR